MLIDTYLPRFHFHETHGIDIDAPAAVVLAAAMAYQPQSDPIVRAAIALRETPSRTIALVQGKKTTPPPFGMNNFTLLDQEEGQEAVFGLVGRFWRLDYGQVPLADAPAFLAFEASGAAKLALNYAVEPLSDGKTRLTTQTRVFCLDRSARGHFTPYWYLIRAVSGLIRRRMLAAVKREAYRS